MDVDSARGVYDETPWMSTPLEECIHDETPWMSTPLEECMMRIR